MHFHQLARSAGTVGKAAVTSTLLDDLNVLSEDIAAEPGEVRVRELVPAAARAISFRLGVTRERDAAADLLRKLPDVCVFLHLRARQVSASADVRSPAAIELHIVPAPEPTAEDAELGSGLTERALLVRHPEKRLAQPRNGLPAVPDPGRRRVRHAIGPGERVLRRSTGCHGSSTKRSGKRSRNDSATRQSEQIV